MAGVRENTIEIAINNQEGEHSYDYNGDEKLFDDFDIAEMDEGNHQIRTNNELDLQITKMIEKNEGVWRCKICGKTTTQKQKIQKHAELHIEGMSHACHICNKTFTNRPNLSNHISQIHTELFSCNICQKTGFNRNSYRMHKRQHDKNKLG